MRGHRRLDVPSFVSSILFSPEVSPNVLFQQVQAQRLESKEVTLLRTISCLSLTEAATSPTSQWPPPPLCEPASHFDGDVTSTFLLYAASHSGPNLGPQIWGHEPLGPYCLIGLLWPPFRSLAPFGARASISQTQKQPVRSFTTLKTATPPPWSPDQSYKPSCAQCTRAVYKSCTTQCTNLTQHRVQLLRFSFLLSARYSKYWIIGSP